MEKKHKKSLSERLIDIWKQADRKTSQPMVIDLRPFIGKNRGKLS